MPDGQIEFIWIGLILLTVLIAITALIVGVLFLIRFFKTRNKQFLVAGLIMTLLLPGLFILLGFLLWLPNAFMAYGPPPSNYTP
ncbi:MAG: hypothetical protein WBM17_04730 [Anaerolineales bacterium]